MGSNILTPKTLLEQFAVTPLPRNQTGIAYDSLDPLFFAREAQSLDWGDPSAAYPPSAFVHSDLADGFLDEPDEQLLSNNMGIQGHQGHQGQGASQSNFPQESETRVDRSPSQGQTKYAFH